MFVDNKDYFDQCHIDFANENFKNNLDLKNIIFTGSLISKNTEYIKSFSTNHEFPIYDILVCYGCDGERCITSDVSYELVLINFLCLFNDVNILKESMKHRLIEHNLGCNLNYIFYHCLFFGSINILDYIYELDNKIISYNDNPKNFHDLGFLKYAIYNVKSMNWIKQKLKEKSLILHDKYISIINDYYYSKKQFYKKKYDHFNKLYVNFNK